MIASELLKVSLIGALRSAAKGALRLPAKTRKIVLTDQDIYKFEKIVSKNTGARIITK